MNEGLHRRRPRSSTDCDLASGPLAWGKRRGPRTQAWPAVHPGISAGHVVMERAPWLRQASIAVIGELREQTEHLQVKPDQRDHQAESAVPLHVLGHLPLCGLVDEIEIEQQVERRQADDEKAEADADRR